MDDTRRTRICMRDIPTPHLPRSPGKTSTRSSRPQLFGREAKFDLAGKRVLDAGTGTGHRLIAAAKSLPDT